MTDPSGRYKSVRDLKFFLKAEAVSLSEKLVTTYKTTLCYNPEDYKDFV
jgi:hypothetical protein